LNEKILNIYLVINDGLIEEFRAVRYETTGSDEEKIAFLKSRAAEDFPSSYHFEAPKDKNLKPMSYNKFYKLEKQGKQFLLFEEIFEKFDMPDSPLVCVTPVVDGKVVGEGQS
jgi:hypothetical protein